MGVTFTPGCMDEAELGLWLDANRRVAMVDQAPRPCDDCTVAFALSMGERCNGVPGAQDTPDHALRRQWWAERSRFYRARAAA